jgi:uncharacterized oxidoreductase
MNLTGNTVLITGGASGIGFALARQLSDRGNRVIICGRSEESLEKAKAQAPALLTRVCDVADPESRRALLAWLKTAHPGLNVVINNAGVQYRRSFTDITALQDLDQEVSINFTAPIHLIGEVLPLLRQQPQSVIVNVSSGLAFSPMADVPVYCATKAAIHSFTLSLRHQLRATGVLVVELAPPIVDTGLGSGTRSEGTARQQLMSPEDFATEALAQLESDQVEIMVGMAANTRKLGEALFDRMNSR